jgi:hypothetical protein
MMQGREVSSVSDEWDFYFTRVNDVLASIFVDLGIRRSVPDSERPWLLWVWVHFRSPRADGLSSSEEAPILLKIEDALGEAVRSACEAAYVGRITTAGRRELYYYGTHTGGFEEAVTQAMHGFPEYEFELGTEWDAGWSQYLRVLYPTPEDYERIKNHHTIEVFEKHGDSLQSLRLVSHWIYFENPDGRAAFIAEATACGFTVKSESKSDDETHARPYGLIVERIDSLDWDSINQATLILFRFARKTNGDYDGWEAPVLNDA